MSRRRVLRADREAEARVVGRVPDEDAPVGAEAGEVLQPASAVIVALRDVTQSTCTLAAFAKAGTDVEGVELVATAAAVEPDTSGAPVL